MRIRPKIEIQTKVIARKQNPIALMEPGERRRVGADEINAARKVMSRRRVDGWIFFCERDLGGLVIVRTK